MVRLAACAPQLVRAADWATWAAIVLVAVIPTVRVGYFLFSVFATPYIVRYAGALGPSTDRICELSWKEPFEYEARVYASQQRNALNATADFFDTAQLLWHIPPTPLSNRFPLHHTTATVVLPRAFSVAYSMGLEMHIHMFVQRAGQLSPHPNITDPHLAYSTFVLAIQNRLTTINTDPDAAADSSIPTDTFVLQAFRRIPWAITLDDYPYRQGHLEPQPAGHSQVDLGSNSNSAPCMYNPNVLVNSVTDNMPVISPLVVRRDYRNLASAGKRKIRVELELRGIRTGWVVVKERWSQHFLPSDTVGTTGAGPGAGSEPPANAVSDRLAKWSMAAVRERIVPLSVPNLLALGSLTILGIVAALVYVKTAAAFWLGPRSKWAGVSRASVAAELASALIYALQTHAILRNTVYLWCLVRYSRFAVSTVVEFSTALRRTQGPAPAPAAPGSQGQVERSIAARKQVDREAWWWLSRAVAPLVLVVYVAAAPFLLRSKVWSAEGAGSLIAFYMRVLYTLHIVPQIVLNARLRSGALMPAIVPLCYSIFRILFALGSSVSDGYLNKSELIEEGIGHIGAAVFVAQRAWYRKPKMD